METKYLRSWLMVGLASLMFGSGLAVYQTHQGYEDISTYTYQSPGVIREGEPVQIFARLADREALNNRLRMDVLFGDSGRELPAEKSGESYSDRLDYQMLYLSENLGPVFQKTVDGGRRRYELIDEKHDSISKRNDFLLALGVALIVGGFASFFLSRRWR